jgi:hypothetical protein
VDARLVAVASEIHLKNGQRASAQDSAVVLQLVRERFHVPALLPI